MIKKFKIFLNEKYEDILKSYGNVAKNLQDERGHTPNVFGRFAHIPSNGLAEKLLEKYYEPGFKLLDIGCGLGNILKLGNEIGYQSTGIEINESLKKYHEGLNVIYGDVLNIDLKFIKDFDVIYLYRPLGPLNKCNKLFEKLYKNCKDNCKIIYVYSSQLELGLKRKFNFEKFDTEFTFMTDRPYDKNFENYYSILTPIKNVEDVDAKEVLNKAIKELSKYRVIDNEDYSRSDQKYGSTFVCDNINNITDFLSHLEKSYHLIDSNNLDIKFAHTFYIEYSEKEEDYNRIKMKSPLGRGKYYPEFDPTPKIMYLPMVIWRMSGIDIGIENRLKRLDIINSIKRDLKRIENYKLKFFKLSVHMIYSKIDGEIYELIYKI